MLIVKFIDIPITKKITPKNSLEVIGTTVTAKGFEPPTLRAEI